MYLGVFVMRREPARTTSFRFRILPVALMASAAAMVMPGPAALAASTEPAGIARPATEAADDPLQIVVSIADQTMVVYKGLQTVATSPVSSGKPGNDTPRGVFSILEKRRKHYSNLYDNAPMPFMQRLTWSGIALHQGRLPGYPASHGCIRLPRDFASDLFKTTERGAHVIVTNETAVPYSIDHPALFRPAAPAGALISGTGDETETVGTEVADLDLKGPIPASQPVTGTATRLDTKMDEIGRWHSRSDKPLRILVTLKTGGDRTRDVQSLLTELGYEPGPVDGAMGPKTARALAAFQEDEGMTGSGMIDDAALTALYEAAGKDTPPNAHLYVRQDFKPLFDTPVSIADPDVPLGTHVFTALSFNGPDQAARWMAVTAKAKGETTAADALDRLEIPDNVHQDIAYRLTPGSSLIVTDRSFRRHTTLGTDFIVQTY